MCFIRISDNFIKDKELIGVIIDTFKLSFISAEPGSQLFKIQGGELPDSDDFVELEYYRFAGIRPLLIEVKIYEP